ncbi:MAG: hypothetical protein KDA91_10270, partial [Planctomycetaceae bacterium]|nr:hypothetical protein [Planctomycetaceae bacterium]
NLVAAQSEVNRVNTLIARWKNYVALRDELAALELARKERDSRQLAALEIKAVMEEKTTEVSSNQSAAEKARMMMTAAEQTMKQKLAEMAEVQKLLDVQQKQLAQREMAQPMVVSALNQARAALAVLAEDAEIKASAATLENIVQRQEKEIVADREQVVAMTQAAAKLNAESDAAAKAMIGCSNANGCCSENGAATGSRIRANQGSGAAGRS